MENVNFAKYMKYNCFFNVFLCFGMTGDTKLSENFIESLKIYPKAITQDPTKTSVIIMGELSGAVIEFDVTIAYDTSAT